MTNGGYASAGHWFQILYLDGFVRQHNGNSGADGVGQAALFAEQIAAFFVFFQSPVGDGADQNCFELGIDEWHESRERLSANQGKLYHIRGTVQDNWSCSGPRGGLSLYSSVLCNSHRFRRLF